MLKIYNTFSKKKEPFQPIHAPKVGFYQCGVTVYDLCHIGHARTGVVFDCIVRYLRSRGFDVFFVRNITDIDDKIIHRAQQLNIPWLDLVEQQITNMQQDFAKLNLAPPDAEPRATENISAIIDIIQNLIQRGHAYQAGNGDVLYSVRSFKAYGKLSGQSIEQLRSGARVDIDTHKRDPLDFVLWKPAKAGEPSWPSPWGDGRPGWHIECSAMSREYLGLHFDIHGGGSDLAFPHHENEIAQSCGACDTPYVNVWMHAGMVTINEEKMSKSLGNFFTIREVLEIYPPEVLRFFLLSGHYRSALCYSDEFLNQAKASLERLYTAIRDVPLSPHSETYDESAIHAFQAAMDDDFNTPEALSVLFNLAKHAQREKGPHPVNAQQSIYTLKKLGAILGILQQQPDAFLQQDQTIQDTHRIEALIAQRDQARADKNWLAADAARDELSDLGIVLEDTPQGTLWRRR